MDVTTDYFTLFGLPIGFAVDLPALQPTWRNLQQQFHPDRFPPDDASAQRHAMAMASHINAAMDVLRDSVRRARYLLELAGHGIDSERSTVADTDFLMAQMDLREQLDEAEAVETFTALEDEARDWLANLAREFALDYVAQDWHEACDSVRKMQFMSRLLDEIRLRRERHEDALDDL